MIMIWIWLDGDKRNWWSSLDHDVIANDCQLNQMIGLWLITLFWLWLLWRRRLNGPWPWHWRGWPRAGSTGWLGWRPGPSCVRGGPAWAAPCRACWTRGLWGPGQPRCRCPCGARSWAFWTFWAWPAHDAACRICRLLGGWQKKKRWKKPNIMAYITIRDTRHARIKLWYATREFVFFMRDTRI